MLNKVDIFVFFAYKKYSHCFVKLQRSNCDITSFLTMSFILFWALTVLFTWESMEHSHKSPGFHPKCLKKYSVDEQRHGGK